MKHFFFLYTILGLTFFLNSSILIASEIAFVKSHKAIIYSDVTLQNPIGYLKYDRKLRIGSNKMRNGEVATVIVSGKVAYVKTRDLSIGEGHNGKALAPKKITEHIVEDHSDFKFGDLIKHNYLKLSYLHYSLSSSTGEFTDASDVTVSYDIPYARKMSGIGLALDHRNPGKKWGLTLGLSYFEQAGQVGGDYSKIFFSELTLTRYFLRRPNYFLGATLGGLISLSSDFSQAKDDQLARSSGQVYGARIGLEAIIFPLSLFGFNLSAGLQGLRYSNVHFNYETTNESTRFNSNYGLYLMGALNLRLGEH